MASIDAEIDNLSQKISNNINKLENKILQYKIDYKNIAIKKDDDVFKKKDNIVFLNKLNQIIENENTKKINEFVLLNDIEILDKLNPINDKLIEKIKELIIDNKIKDKEILEKLDELSIKENEITKIKKQNYDLHNDILNKLNQISEREKKISVLTEEINKLESNKVDMLLKTSEKENIEKKLEEEKKKLLDDVCRLLELIGTEMNDLKGLESNVSEEKKESIKKIIQDNFILHNELYEKYKISEYNPLIKKLENIEYDEELDLRGSLIKHVRNLKSLEKINIDNALSLINPNDIKYWQNEEFEYLAKYTSVSKKNGLSYLTYQQVINIDFEINNKNIIDEEKIYYRDLLWNTIYNNLDKFNKNIFLNKDIINMFLINLSKLNNGFKDDAKPSDYYKNIKNKDEFINYMNYKEEVVISAPELYEKAPNGSYILEQDWVVEYYVGEIGKRESKKVITKKGERIGKYYFPNYGNAEEYKNSMYEKEIEPVYESPKDPKEIPIPLWQMKIKTLLPCLRKKSNNVNVNVNIDIDFIFKCLFLNKLRTLMEKNIINEYVYDEKFYIKFDNIYNVLHAFYIQDYKNEIYLNNLLNKYTEKLKKSIDEKVINECNTNIDNINNQLSENKYYSLLHLLDFSINNTHYSGLENNEFFEFFNEVIPNIFHNLDKYNYEKLYISNHDLFSYLYKCNLHHINLVKFLDFKHMDDIIYEYVINYISNMNPLDNKTAIYYNKLKSKKFQKVEEVIFDPKDLFKVIGKQINVDQITLEMIENCHTECKINDIVVDIPINSYQYLTYQNVKDMLTIGGYYEKLLIDDNRYLLLDNKIFSNNGITYKDLKDIYMDKKYKIGDDNDKKLIHQTIAKIFRKILFYPDLNYMDFLNMNIYKNAFAVVTFLNKFTKEEFKEYAKKSIKEEYINIIDETPEDIFQPMDFCIDKIDHNINNLDKYVIQCSVLAEMVNQGMLNNIIKNDVIQFINLNIFKKLMNNKLRQKLSEQNKTDIINNDGNELKVYNEIFQQLINAIIESPNIANIILPNIQSDYIIKSKDRIHISTCINIIKEKYPEMKIDNFKIAYLRSSERQIALYDQELANSKKINDKIRTKKQSQVSTKINDITIDITDNKEDYTYNIKFDKPHIGYDELKEYVVDNLFLINELLFYHQDDNLNEILRYNNLSKLLIITDISKNISIINITDIKEISFTNISEYNQNINLKVNRVKSIIQSDEILKKKQTDDGWFIIPFSIILKNNDIYELKYEFFCGAAKCIYFYYNEHKNKYILLGLFTYNLHMKYVNHYDKLDDAYKKVNINDILYEKIISEYIKDKRDLDICKFSFGLLNKDELGYKDGGILTGDVGFIDLQLWIKEFMFVSNRAIKRKTFLQLSLVLYNLIIKLYKNGYLYVDLKLQNIMLFLKNDKFEVKFIDLGSIIPVNMTLGEYYNIIFIQCSKANCAWTFNNNLLLNFHDVNQKVEDKNIFKEYIFDINNTEKIHKDIDDYKELYEAIYSSYLMNIMYFITNLYVYFVSGYNFEGDVNNQNNPDAIPIIELFRKNIKNIYYIDNDEFKRDEQLIKIFIEFIDLAENKKKIGTNDKYNTEIHLFFRNFINVIYNEYQNDIMKDVLYVGGCKYLLDKLVNKIKKIKNTIIFVYEKDIDPIFGIKNDNIGIWGKGYDYIKNNIFNEEFYKKYLKYLFNETEILVMINKCKIELDEIKGLSEQGLIKGIQKSKTLKIAKCLENIIIYNDVKEYIIKTYYKKYKLDLNILNISDSKDNDIKNQIIGDIRTIYDIQTIQINIEPFSIDNIKNILIAMNNLLDKYAKYENVNNLVKGRLIIYCANNKKQELINNLKLIINNDNIDTLIELIYKNNINIDVVFNNINKDDVYTIINDIILDQEKILGGNIYNKNNISKLKKKHSNKYYTGGYTNPSIFSNSINIIIIILIIICLLYCSICTINYIKSSHCNKLHRHYQYIDYYQNNT